MLSEGRPGVDRQYLLHGGRKQDLVLQSGSDTD